MRQGKRVLGGVDGCMRGGVRGGKGYVWTEGDVVG